MSVLSSLSLPLCFIACYLQLNTFIFRYFDICLSLCGRFFPLRYSSKVHLTLPWEFTLGVSVLLIIAKSKYNWTRCICRGNGSCWKSARRWVVMADLRLVSTCNFFLSSIFLYWDWQQESWEANIGAVAPASKVHVGPVFGILTTCPSLEQFRSIFTPFLSSISWLTLLGTHLTQMITSLALQRNEAMSIYYYMVLCSSCLINENYCISGTVAPVGHLSLFCQHSLVYYFNINNHLLLHTQSASHCSHLQSI